ncbi:MAG: hypothetical protein RJA61_455 [Candidatus Parcubacteria bacterium]|jgi:hypothetical protein
MGLWKKIFGPKTSGNAAKDRIEELRIKAYSVPHPPKETSIPQEVMIEISLEELLAQHVSCDPRILLLGEAVLGLAELNAASRVDLVQVKDAKSLEDGSVLSFFDMLKLVYKYPDLQNTRSILSRPFLLANGEMVVGRASSFFQPQPVEESVFVEDSYQAPVSCRRIKELWLCKPRSSWPNHFVPVRV